MIKIILTIYGIVAALVFVGFEIFMVKSIYELKRDEEYLEEDPHEGLGCVALVVSLMVAAMWPAVPLLLFGTWLMEKLMQKHPELCGLEDEGGGEDGS